MNNYFKYFFTVIVISCILQSCKDDDNAFDKSPSERLEDAKVELKQVLISAEDGWEFVYFTDSASYGGYNFLMSFTDKEVTVQGGNLFPSGKHKSSYALDFPQSLALTFDSYNTAFSLLGDPDKNSLTSASSSLGGENSLLWLRTSENKDTIFFKSKNSHTPSKMIRHNGDWDSYISRINLMSEKFSGGSMNKYFREIVLADGTSRLFTGYDYITRTLSPLTVSGDYVYVNNNGVAPVSDGFLFTKPVDINGKNVSKIMYDDTQGIFTVDAEGTTGTMKSVAEPSFVFAGKDGQPLNKMIFLPKEMYSLSGATPEVWEALDSVLQKSYRILNDQYHVWKDYYGMIFYPISYSDTKEYAYHSLGMMFINDGDDPNSDEDDALDFVVEVRWFNEQVDLDNSRTDKLSIKRPFLNRWDYSCYKDDDKGHTDIFTVDPEIKTYLTQALSLLATSTAGSPYIIIPSSDFKSFTFGSTERNSYFKMNFVRKFE